MAPKPRSKVNRPLPSRWAIKHNAYYYRVPDNQKHLWDGKSWFRLGASLAEAHRTFSARLHDVAGAKVVTVGDLLDRFQFEFLPTKKPATQDYYLKALPVLRTVFNTNPIPVALLEPRHAYQMTDHISKQYSVKKARQCAECLSSALSFGVKKGVLKQNPLVGQFRKPSAQGRDRHVTDQELLAFTKTLPRKWQLYIMLKLHCKGRRKGELLGLNRSDLLEEGILFTNNKRTRDRFIVPWTQDLRGIVQEIIDLHPPRVGDAPLFFTNNFKPYLKPSGATTSFDTMWQRYMKAAVEAGVCDRFTEHDLRAKAVEHETEDVAARLLRHTSVGVTQKHYRRKPEVL